MAGNVYWRGDAPATSDVWTVTLATVPTGNGTLSVTVGSAGKTVSVAYATGEALAVIAQRIADALADSAIPEVRELAWTYPGTGAVVTGTGPLGILTTVVSAAVTAATGISATLAHAATATGPNWGDNPANWSTGTLPGTNAGETAVVEGGPDILFGLAGLFSGANAVATLFWRGATKGGLPRRNTSGGEPGYWEYRQRWIDLPGTSVVVGDDARPGPDRLVLNATANLTLSVWKTGTPEEDGTPCVDLRTAAAVVCPLNVYGGSAGHAVTVDATTGRVTPVSCSGDATLYLNDETGTLNQQGGTVYDRSALTTLNIKGGTYWKDGGTVGAITADSGTVRLLHSQGTTITCTFRGSVAGDPPVLDLSGNDSSPRDLSNTSSFTGGAFVLDPFGTADLTTVTFDMQSLAASDIGRTFQITRP